MASSFARRKWDAGWQDRRVGDRQAGEIEGRRTRRCRRGQQIGPAWRRQRLPGPAVRREDGVRAAVSLAHDIGRVHRQAGCETERHRRGNGCVAAAGIGPDILLRADGGRAGFAHQPRQLGRRIAAADDQPAAACAQIGIQRTEAAEQEGQAFLAGGKGGQQSRVEDENGKDRLRGVRGLMQCLIVGQPQIASRPPDGNRHSLSPKDIPATL